MDEAKPQDLSVISEIVALVQVPLLIVGARSLQLYQGPISNFRTTLDWDVAIAVDSWMTYGGVRRQLINSGRWAADNQSGDHRLRHIPTGALVDLLPFGQICDPRGVLTLPGSRQQLNMAGFEEAFDCATAITDIERPDLGTIRVATPPAIAALKFISYSDRPAERVRRDLPDIAHILRQYGKSRWQEDRLYEAEFLLSPGGLKPANHCRPYIPHWPAPWQVVFF
ncbi:MAG: hypothetical protein ACP5O7_09180 [Phycisphaerae bacterium]